MSGSKHSVSINGALYERLRAYSHATLVPMSQLVEQILVDFESGPLPKERVKAASKPEHEPAPTFVWRDQVRTPTPSAPSDPTAALSSFVRVDWPPSVVEAVEDSLGDGRPGRGKQPARDLEMTCALDAAITRMLDRYEALAQSATHCAICRVRSKNAKPFVPKLAGESVVAACTACMREGRALDGRRSA